MHGTTIKKKSNTTKSTYHLFDARAIGAVLQLQNYSISILEMGHAFFNRPTFFFFFFFSFSVSCFFLFLDRFVRFRAASMTIPFSVSFCLSCRDDLSVLCYYRRFAYQTLVNVILLDLLITSTIIRGFFVLLLTRFTHCKLCYNIAYFFVSQLFFAR